MRLVMWLVVLALGAAVVPVNAADETPEQAAMRVMDDFLSAFNAADLDAWRATLNFPHVRIAGGKVTVVEKPADYASAATFDALRASGWRRSYWGARRVVQAGPDKVHVVVDFTRYGENQRIVGTFKSLYIITRQNGRWGIQARSSYAP